MNILAKAGALLAVSTFVLVACAKKDGAEYLGNWKDKEGHVASFVKDGDAIFFVIEKGRRFPATLTNDNTLQVHGTAGAMVMSYAKSSDSIFSEGRELKRATSEDVEKAKAPPKVEPIPNPADYKGQF